jgi:hypothetical protein
MRYAGSRFPCRRAVPSRSDTLTMRP